MISSLADPAGDRSILRADRGRRARGQVDESRRCLDGRHAVPDHSPVRRRDRNGFHADLRARARTGPFQSHRPACRQPRRADRDRLAAYRNAVGAHSGDARSRRSARRACSPPPLRSRRRFSPISTDFSPQPSAPTCASSSPPYCGGAEPILTRGRVRRGPDGELRRLFVATGKRGSRGTRRPSSAPPKRSTRY